MLEMGRQETAGASQRLIPVELAGRTVMVAVAGEGLAAVAGAVAGEEREVSGRVGKPALEQVLDGLAVLATEIAARMRTTDATRVGVEFGCDIAVESGALVAVIGKASATSSIKVSLEWSERER